MKKALFILTLIAVAIVCGCSKDDFAPGKNLASISFSVSMDDSNARAVIDADGDATKVNRCVLQIWNGNTLFKTVVRTAPAGTREYSFKGVTLDPEETYDFLFWADCGTVDGGDLYYTTESLRNVRMLQAGRYNDDAADAFCNRVLGCRIETEYESRLILRRPLAQLNIISTDIDAVAQMPLAWEFAPQSISYSFSGCTAFDVREGKSVGEAQLISVNDAPIYGKTAADGSCTLAMSYIFPQDGKSVSSVDFRVRSANDAVVSNKCDNVPLQENHRTNIIGKLMTVKGDFSVCVSPMFDGDISAW